MDFAAMDTEEEEGEEGDLTITAEPVGLGYGDVEKAQTVGRPADVNINMEAEDRERMREEAFGIGGSGSAENAWPADALATGGIEEDMGNDEESEVPDGEVLARLSARLDALSAPEAAGPESTNEAVAIVSLKRRQLQLRL